MRIIGNLHINYVGGKFYFLPKKLDYYNWLYIGWWCIGRY